MMIFGYACLVPLVVDFLLFGFGFGFGFGFVLFWFCFLSCFVLSCLALPRLTTTQT
jgi:hypothetical protein